MLNRLILASSLATVVAFGAMPTAAAQIDAAQQAIPYAITFNGSHYPADLETVSYPFASASISRNGQCLLSVMTDDIGQIAAMTILSCSDELFEREAETLIKRQVLASPVSASLTAHTLSISWDIGPAAELVPVQLAVR